MKFLLREAIILCCLLSNMLVLAQNDKQELVKYLENGDYSNALNISNKLIIFDSINSEVWFENGKINSNLFLYNKAINSFKRAIQIDSNQVSYKLALAKTFNSSGRINEAIKEYEGILTGEPENLAALLKLGNIYLNKKQSEKAYPIYYKLHQLDSTNSEYVRKMAKCREIDKDWQELIRLLEKAYIMDDLNMLVILDLTKIYIRTEQNDTAISILNKAIKQYPTSGKLYSRRGNAYFGLNYHFRSIPDFKKAIELNADSKLLQKRLGISKYSIKKYKEAKEILEKLIVNDTTDYQVCLYLGNTYNGLGDYEKAIEFFEKAIHNITPEKLIMSSIYSGLADSYRIAGQYYKEIEMIKKKQNVLPRKHQTIYHLLEIAEIYEDDLNDKKKAIQYYEDFYASSEESKWIPEEQRNSILTKINRLKEDLHFEQ